jgi:hypothetical protein
VFARRGARYSRDQEPFSFWFAMAIYGIGLLSVLIVSGNDCWKYVIKGVQGN